MIVYIRWCVVLVVRAQVRIRKHIRMQAVGRRMGIRKRVRTWRMLVGVSYVIDDTYFNSDTLKSIA